MSLIALGVSHRTAPVVLLERMTLPGEPLAKLLTDLVDNSTIDEALVLSTCNRIEIYVEAEMFHPAVDLITDRLTRHTGVPSDELVPHLYVHYEDRAVQHLFSVTSGLDSMVIGEGQILGQVRTALRIAQDEGTLGRVLNDLTQNALRVGKRAHSETGIDRAAPSLVSVGLALAEQSLDGLTGRAAVVVGAGSMGALAATSLHNAGARVTLLNRTPESAQRLATTLGARALPLASLGDALTSADLVVSCTGAIGHVIDTDVVAAAQQTRAGRPLVLLDLAMPRDIDSAVLGLPGVRLIDLEQMNSLLQDGAFEQDVEGARRIVATEVNTFLDARHSARVEPTVVALRGLAAQIVEREMQWYAARNPDLTSKERADIEHLVRRVVDKLLHAPTVRVKELASEPDGEAYAEALHRLFDLDLRTVDALRTPDLEDGRP
jgi:glutamyl-tRNA reductase